MGRVHRFLGLEPAASSPTMTPDQRRAQYATDITYGTNNEFGFDYLRDNMAWDADELGPARPQLRDRRRGRLDPHRRGPHAADHLRPGRPARPSGTPSSPASSSASTAARTRRRLRGRREEAHRRRPRGRHRAGRGPPRHRQPLRDASTPRSSATSTTPSRPRSCSSATRTTSSWTARC